MHKPPSDRRTRPCARIALIDASDELTTAISGCLSQLGVEAAAVSRVGDLAVKKFEGFVVDLRRSDAEEILKTIRGSARNGRAVLFGVYSDQSEIRSFSKYGINGLFAWPFKRADAIKVLRSTQTLLMHELRRYARIPLAIEVEFIVSHQRSHGISRDLSVGGMSIQFSKLPKAAKAEQAEANFLMPHGKSVSLQGVVCWALEADSLVGIQFLPQPEALKLVRAWVDDYLGIS